MTHLYYPTSGLKSLRLYFYWSSAIFLFLLALLSLYATNPDTLTIELICGTIFLFTALIVGNSKKQYERHWLERVSLFAIMGVGLWTASDYENITYLVFIIPIYAHLLFTFKKANWLVLIFSLLLLYVSYSAYPFASMIQVFFSYISCAILITIIALMSEYHKQFLRQTLNLDQYIQAYNEQQLEIDLNKEVPRSDRQGSLLAYITIRLKSTHVPKRELSEINRLAQKMSMSLRLNDSLYLLKPYHFVVVLSGGEKSDIAEVFTQIQQHIEYFKEFSYTPKLHFYSQEDDTEALLQNIKGALHVI